MRRVIFIEFKLHTLFQLITQSNSCIKQNHIEIGYFHAFYFLVFFQIVVRKRIFLHTANETAFLKLPLFCDTRFAKNVM